MGRKHAHADDDDDDDLGEAYELDERGGSGMGTKLLAAVGLITIAAIVVPAVLMLVSEGPNLRRYMRIMRM